MNAIPKETYAKLDTNIKLDILFDYLTEIHKKVEILEKHRIRYITAGMLTGFLGGLSAVFGKTIFWKN